jgi:hypothetical protein
MCEKAQYRSRPMKMRKDCEVERRDVAMPSVRDIAPFRQVSHLRLLRLCQQKVFPRSIRLRLTGQSLFHSACHCHDNLVLADLGFVRRATYHSEQIISLELCRSGSIPSNASGLLLWSRPSPRVCLVQGIMVMGVRARFGEQYKHGCSRLFGVFDSSNSRGILTFSICAYTLSTWVE